MATTGRNQKCPGGRAGSIARSEWLAELVRLGLAPVALALTLVTGGCSSGNPEPGASDGGTDLSGPGPGVDGGSPAGDASGPLQPDGGPFPPPSSKSQELFDEVWRTFDQRYSYFTYKGVDWLDVGRRHRPSFAEELAPAQFAERLATMLRELRDLHVSVATPDGTYLEVYSREVAQNYTSRPRNRYTQDGYQVLGDGIVWHARVGSNADIAYIRIDTLSQSAFAGISDADIEALFAAYAGASGMIIDIRPNSGGSEENAARFASRLTNETVTYGHYKFRDGPGHDDFGPLESKTLAPSSGTHFDGPVVALIGQRCMSSAEWLTLMLRASLGVTLVGDRTRGASANPEEHTLANGVTYAVSRWIAYTDEMVEIEDRGIDPEVAIAAADSFDGEHDYVVERAIQILEENDY